MEIDDLNRILGGKISFFPAQNWAMQRYEITEASLVTGKWYEGTVSCDFEYVAGKTPLLKKYTQIYDFPEADTVRRYIYEFSDVNGEADIDQDQFFLTYYGWPEPPFARESTIFTFWNMVAGMLTAILVLALIYRMRSGRQQ